MTAAAPRRLLSGLAISGFLLALPGGLLPLWNYHLRAELSTAADYFLLLGAGVVCGAPLSRRFRAEHVLAAGSVLAAVSIAGLAFAAPPAPVWAQMLALFLSGLAASTISTAVLESLAPAYELDRAGLVLQAGFFFGAGSVAAAWLTAECLDRSPEFLALAAVPFLAFSRVRLQRASVAEVPVARAIQDLRSVLALLFALLLFFQFASEWSIAAWLPIFLIDRLGMSPSGAVMMLSFYWLALTLGRAVAARLLRRFSHSRMLAASAFCALAGCALLRLAGTSFGVLTSILLVGAGFSLIYPLAAERISTRFTYYHPGYFNGIFTVAMLGGILTPFLLGHAAAAWGLEIVPVAAMAGSCGVFALILLIRLGRKVSGT